MRADWEIQLEAPPADTHYKTEDATATKGNELEGYFSKQGLLMRLHGEKGFGRPCCKSTILQFITPSGGNYRRSLLVLPYTCEDAAVRQNRILRAIAPIIPFQYYDVTITLIILFLMTITPSILLQRRRAYNDEHITKNYGGIAIWGQ